MLEACEIVVSAAGKESSDEHTMNDTQAKIPGDTITSEFSNPLKIDLNPIKFMMDAEDSTLSPSADNESTRAPDPSPADRKNSADDGSQSSRYQSSRAAAIVAKNKISSKHSKHREDEKSGSDELVDTKDTNTNSPKLKSVPKTKSKDTFLPYIQREGSMEEEMPWVLCDLCGKWRRLPSHVDTNKLPEKWYCSMNKWDNDYNSCDKVEQQIPAVESSQAGGSLKQEGELIQEDNIKSATKRGRKKPSSGEDFNESEDELGGLKKKGRSSTTSNPTLLERVNWVQCNRCTKWRKVPLSIAMENLPDKWYCTMNTWDLAYAKCNVKEEVDEKVESNSVSTSDGADKVLSPAASKNNRCIRRPQSSSINSSQSTLSGHKRVTQWVQCEKRNCKKWRKLPGHVDMKQLPEKWFCEMNKWDPERANCDVSEDSDTDVETNVQGDRSQILINVKGPGTLSYRRIIFGPDGKVRAAYNEKSKNGYGVFSFADSHKNSGSDDSSEMQKRVGYWWSHAYDEGGVNFVSSCRSYTGTTGVLGPKKESKAEPKDNNQELTAISSDVHSVHDKSKRTDLLCAIQRFSNRPHTHRPSPKKLVRSEIPREKTRIEIDRVECNIIRSCLLVGDNYSLSISKLMFMIQNMTFLSDLEEKCRLNASMSSIKQSIRRLEEQNEVDVYINSKGEMVVQAAQPVLSPLEVRRRLPPKLASKLS